MTFPIAFYFLTFCCCYWSMWKTLMSSRTLHSENNTTTTAEHWKQVNRWSIFAFCMFKFSHIIFRCRHLSLSLLLPLLLQFNKHILAFFDLNAPSALLNTLTRTNTQTQYRWQSIVILNIARISHSLTSALFAFHAYF